MARNKYPEETVNKILEVSTRLFIEKGYDGTSIQDIVNALGGLSKGAIYHHFKSKEDILLAVADRISEATETRMVSIRDDKKLNGMGKLKKMFAASMEEKGQMEFIAAIPNLLDNPRMLAVQISSMQEDVVPNYVEPVVREGAADGSIPTDYPRELAEFLIWMTNIWMNPIAYHMTKEEVGRKIEFFDHILESIGIHIMDDDVKKKLNKLQKLAE